MKKRARLIAVTLLLVLLSGCFVFVPVDDGHHRGGRGHDHGDGHDHNGDYDDHGGHH